MSKAGRVKEKPGRLFLRHLTWKLQIVEEKMDSRAAHPENLGKSYLQTILSFFLILALCCFYLLVCSPVPGYALGYYVDSNAGDDNYDGRSPSWNGSSGPWRTLRKVYLMSSPSSSPRIQGGDVVYLKRGSTFMGNTLTDYPGNITAAFALQCSGSLGSYITIAAYPDPEGSLIKDKPVILGNGLTCGIYLDQSYITIKDIAITYNSVIAPVLSLLLLDDPSQTASASTSAAPASAASTSLAITPIPLPPPSLASSRFRRTRPNCRWSDTPILPPPDPEVLQKLLAHIPELPLTSVPFPPPLPAHYAIPPFPASSAPSPPPPLPTVIAPAAPQSLAFTPDPTAMFSLPEDIKPRAHRSKGKGIIIPNSETDTSPGPNNIMIENCDIYWCPLSGISIENSGVIWIKGTWYFVDNKWVSTCNICGNGESGIEIMPYTYEENGQNKKNKCNITNINISGCDIYENYFHGVYLESAGNSVTCNGNPSDPGYITGGDNVTIYNNHINYNGNALYYTGDPTHNLYLWGNGAVVTKNQLSYAQPRGNGCGLRYCGSGLLFGTDADNNPLGNELRDNNRHAIGLWSNDPYTDDTPYNNCFGNIIMNNTIYVKNTGLVYNNAGINIGYDSSNKRFSYTTIIKNNIVGYNEPPIQVQDRTVNACGIGIQKVDLQTLPGYDQVLNIQKNNFYALRGPQVEIEQSLPDGWASGLNTGFCAPNFFHNPNLDYIWFDDGSGYCNWEDWYDSYGHNPYNQPPPYDIQDSTEDTDIWPYY